MVDDETFIKSLARRYDGRGVPLTVLEDAARAGLAEAAPRYDIELGVSLQTYAVWHVRRNLAAAIKAAEAGADDE